MLEVNGISASYGVVPALHAVSFRVRPSEIVALLGHGASGKSTILRVVAGLQRASHGRILFQNEAIQNLPLHTLVDRGLVYVPQGNLCFPHMTVHENLLLGAYRKSAWPLKEKTLRDVYSLFPILRERSNLPAKLMSGADQQVLKIGRGLMAKPRLLLVDAPSRALAVKETAVIGQALKALRDNGLTIVLADQNAVFACGIADRGYRLQEGRIVLEGSAKELLKSNGVSATCL